MKQLATCDQAIAAFLHPMPFAQHNHDKGIGVV